MKTGIYQALDESYFIERFREMGRKDQFSYAGLKALYEFLEQLSEDCGEPIEFDCIALCCEYQEMENIAEFNEQYGTEYESRDDIDETIVIPVDDEAFIIQQF